MLSSAQLRQTTRALARRPAFAIAAVLTLALCIGANTAIFSVVNAVLLQGLEYRDPDRLVHVWSADARRGEARSRVRVADFADWRSSLATFEELAAYHPGWQVTAVGAGEPQRLTAAGVTANLFRVLGVAPALGRAPTPEEEMDSPRVAVLSHGFWQRGFGGDSSVLGRRITLGAEGLPLGGSVTVGGDAYAVVGVMPPGFELPVGRSDVYVPIGALGRPAAGGRGPAALEVVGRLREGRSLDDARREIAFAARRIDRAHPEAGGWGADAVPLRDRVVGDTRRDLWLLLAVVGAVLLVGCVNVAGLLLGRAAGRSRELAVRAALGAGRGALVRLLLTESALIAAASGLLAVLVGAVGARWLASLAPSTLPRLHGVGVDGRVLLFTAAVACLAALVCGLLPALRAARVSPNDALSQGDSRGATSGPRARRMRTLLVATETALGVALVICAGLLARSFAQLRDVDPGFRAERAVAMRVVLARWRYPSPSDRARVVSEALDRVRRLPGVAVVGATSRLPLHDPPSSTALTIDGAAVEPPAQRPRVGAQSVSGSYFRAVGIPLRSGREFDERDAASDARPVIVNEAFARRFLSGRAAIGARLRFGTAAEPGPAHAIVGVVGDTRDDRLRERASPQVFFDYRQSTPAEFNFVARTPAGARVAAAIRRELTAIDPLVPALEPIELGRVLDDATAGERFMALLVGAFAALSLLLAAVGVYGTMAEAVASRTREMGLRLALGARPADVRRLVLREAGLVVGGALLGGIPLAWAGAQAIRGLLYGVGAADPATYAAAIGVASAAAFVACYVPARRASRVDPVISLEGE